MHGDLYSWHSRQSGIHRFPACAFCRQTVRKCRRFRLPYIQRRTIPVSYTHLDVYKRQEQKGLYLFSADSQSFGLHHDGRERHGGKRILERCHQLAAYRKKGIVCLLYTSCESERYYSISDRFFEILCHCSAASKCTGYRKLYDYRWQR